MIHHKAGAQPEARRLQIHNQPCTHQESTAEMVVDPEHQTTGQILIRDGIPASIAAGTGLAIAGFTLTPVLAAGLAAGAVFTILRTHSQS